MGESPTSIWCEPIKKGHSLPRESSFKKSSTLKFDHYGLVHFETMCDRVKHIFVRSTWGSQDPDFVNQLGDANLGLEEAMVNPNVVTWLQFALINISKIFTLMISLVLYLQISLPTVTPARVTYY